MVNDGLYVESNKTQIDTAHCPTAAVIDKDTLRYEAVKKKGNFLITSSFLSKHLQ